MQKQTRLNAPIRPAPPRGRGRSLIPSMTFVAALALLAALVSLPATAADTGDTTMIKPTEPEGLVADFARALTGRWQLDARLVANGTRYQAAHTQQLTVYDMREISADKATGKVLILETGILETFVESPELFEEHPDLVGNSYSLGGLWDVILEKAEDSRCDGGQGVSMRFLGETEGSYGIFEYGCVASNTTGFTMCPTSTGFEMVGVTLTETGVEGVFDKWTEFSLITDGEHTKLTHELPRAPAPGDRLVPILRDFYTKLDSETKVQRQSVEGIWNQLVEDKTLVMNQLNTVQLLATL
ncbi:MAG: hypothetical protein AAGC60_04865 [Acidobacteriota bacterium]